MDVAKILNNIIRSRNNQSLKEKRLSELLAFLDSWDDNVVNFSHLCERILEKISQSDDINIRLEAIQVADVLFLKFGSFREELTKHLHHVISNTINLDASCWTSSKNNSLQKIQNYKDASLKIILKWHELFGRHYLKLNLMLPYLKQNKSIDLDRQRVITSVDRKRLYAEEKRQNLLAERILKLYTSYEGELTNSVVGLENGLNLLLPNFPTDELNVIEKHLNLLNDDHRDKPASINCFDVELTPKTVIKKSIDNADLLVTLNDDYKLLKRKYGPKLQFWLNSLKRYHIDNSHSVHIRINGLVQRITNLLSKYEEIQIVNHSDSEDADNDDFVSVNEELFGTTGSDQLLAKRLDDIETFHKNIRDKDPDQFRLSLLKQKRKCDEHTQVVREARDWKDIAFEDELLIEKIKREKGIDLTDDGKKKHVKSQKAGSPKSRLIKKMKMRSHHMVKLKN